MLFLNRVSLESLSSLFSSSIQRLSENISLFPSLRALQNLKHSTAHRSIYSPSTCTTNTLNASPCTKLHEFQPQTPARVPSEHLMLLLISRHPNHSVQLSRSIVAQEPCIPQLPALAQPGLAIGFAGAGPLITASLEIQEARELCCRPSGITGCPSRHRGLRITGHNFAYSNHYISQGIHMTERSSN